MATFHFPLGTERPLAEMFADIPAHVKSYLKGGFDILAKVSEAHLGELVKTVSESFRSHYAISPVQLASQLNLSTEQASALLAATSLLAMALSSREEPVEEVVQAAIQAGLLENSHKDAALRFSSSITDRQALKQALDRSRVSSEILPSLIDFETTVDMRLSFDKNEIKFAVPVALVHLDTDANNQEVWFQLNKKEVERMINDLQSTLRRMEEVEKWSKTISKDK